MPIGDFVNSIPPAIFFLFIHLVAFSAGAYFAPARLPRRCGNLGAGRSRSSPLGLRSPLRPTTSTGPCSSSRTRAQRGARLARLRPRLHRCHQRRDREAPWWRAARDDLQPDGPCGAGRGAGPDLLLGACAAALVEPVATDQVDLPPSYRFEPEVITVADGTTVTRTNHDNFTTTCACSTMEGTRWRSPRREQEPTFTGPRAPLRLPVPPQRHDRHGHRHRGLSWPRSAETRHGLGRNRRDAGGPIDSSSMTTATRIDPLVLQRGHPNLVRGGLRRADPRAGARVGGDQQRATRSSTRRRERQDAGSVPVVPGSAHGGAGPAEADGARPLRQPAQGPHLRRRAQPARPAGRDPAHGRTAGAASARDHGRQPDGDTLSDARRALVRNPPDILVTTPRVCT